VVVIGESNLRVWGCDPLPTLSAWGHLGSAGVKWGRNGGKGVPRGKLTEFPFMPSSSDLQSKELGRHAWHRRLQGDCQLAWKRADLNRLPI
jgi:hypothetical protein